MITVASHQTLAVTVADSSAVGQARRAAASFAERVGLDEVGAGELALIVTEASTNLLQHAGGGELLLRAIASGQGGVEVLALDKGPGMANVDRCMEDGYSTGGSRGAGLGSIARLADRFDVWSRAGAGTALYAARLAPPGDAHVRGRADFGAVCVAHPGEEVVGDAWAADDGPDRTIVLMVDGLGHGPLASDAAQAAVRIFEADPTRSPAAHLERIHGALRATRGAAASVFAVDWKARRVSAAGVGNIAGTLISAERNRGLSTHNGILGQGQPRLQEFDYPWPDGGTMVIHSDGIGTRWDLEAYPGILFSEPGLVAGVLYRDFSRRRDDATVVVLREAVTS